MITLYTTQNCPVCNMIKQKLAEENIKYDLCMDIELMQAMGITNVPVLEVSGVRYNAPQIIKMINEGVLKDGIH